MSRPDANDLLALAQRACDAAEAVLLEGVAHRLETPLTTWSKSSATDLATEMDVAAEDVVVETILQARPGDTVLGEEGGDRARATGSSAPVDDSTPADKSVRWVVDPLDGTINYIYGLPHWAVSIAAQVDGVTVAGVVGVPLLGERFTAVRGAGAALRHRGGEPVRLVVPAPPRASAALVATGFGYAQERRREQAEVVSRLLPQVRDIRRLGAAAIDLCHVACGRVDAYFERGLQPWDLAAGALVAAEAGVRVEGLAGAEAGEAMVIAAAPALFDEIHGLVAGDTPPGGLSS